MADSSAFNYYFSGVTGMGNPLTPGATPIDDWEKEIYKQMDPTVAGALLLNRKREDAYNDSARLREQMQIYKEFRMEEAQQANKMALQRQLLSEIPAAIRSYGQAAAQFAYNAPRLQILANVPDQIRAGYGAFPNLSVPRSRGFS